MQHNWFWSKIGNDYIPEFNHMYNVLLHAVLNVVNQVNLNVTVAHRQRGGDQRCV